MAPHPVKTRKLCMNINARISTNRSLPFELQHVKGDYDSYYYFPDPGLITFANAERQKIYLRQLNHVLDSLIYRASSVNSDALPVHPQKWRNLLEAEDLLSSCLRARTVAINLIPPTPQNDEPFDCRRGRELVWHLSELNFRGQLLVLDRRHAQAPLLKGDEDITAMTTSFRMEREQAVLRVFPEQSLTFIDVTVVSEGLSSHDWEVRSIHLEALQDVMQKWNVPLPGSCFGLLVGTEWNEVGCKKILAAHYAQTFYASELDPPPVLFSPYLTLDELQHQESEAYYPDGGL
ncbi:uncharacterized protein BT62DRAFT_1009311 [Guyanagaster necrorhizus]|uniref:Uncharacterized protein n=1 Tax=Guyanagaster necrorhizus TaxID=856835 RepID=A0A9P7VMY6_9AGAR|nr:uncharacterized protein BT62DRAFT_1009311 [Guyanagaster necrorhizus MCA 3950]KAG7443498.1 hypothetical protein BT62DRAFT_1009311 [Guyanagaster necrorhizus MCA 3950]